MSVAAIFLIAALILFVLSALGVAARFNLTAAGLACVTTALLLSNGMI